MTQRPVGSVRVADPDLHGCTLFQEAGSDPHQSEKPWRPWSRGGSIDRWSQNHINLLRSRIRIKVRRIRKPGYNQTALDTARRVFEKRFQTITQTDSQTGRKEEKEMINCETQEKRNDQFWNLLPGYNQTDLKTVRGFFGNAFQTVLKLSN